MSRFKCIRRIRKVGKSAYLSLPKLARLELNLFINDEVEIELDTRQKKLILRAAQPRTIAPTIDLNQMDMLPAASVDPAPAAAAPITDDAGAHEKLPAA